MLRAARLGVVLTVAIVACGACGDDLPTAGPNQGIVPDVIHGPLLFKNTSSCIAYLGALDARGEDVNHDFIPDGDSDPSNDGLDPWGRPILDAETECSCTSCLMASLN